MKKFKFKLEAILKMRELKEDQCKAEIGKIQSKINLLNDYKVSENQGIDKAYTDQEIGLGQGMKGQELHFHPYFIRGKRARINQIDTEVAELTDELTDKFEELKKLRADVKVIQKMKEKEKKKYKKEFNKKQFAQIEEQVQNWKQVVEK